MCQVSPATLGASKNMKFRLSRNSTKFGMVARFRETNSTARSVSSLEIYKNSGSSIEITVLPFLRKFEFPRVLQNVIEVRSFMGLVGYYRRFVNGFSIIASPLTKLLRKDVKFEWNDKCQASFEQLKQLLIEAPVLTQSTAGKEYTLYSDASRISLRCVLMQDGKVVAYASKQLKLHE